MAIASVKEVFDTMPKRFNANAAKGMNAVFQFDITGEGGGNWNVADSGRGPVRCRKARPTSPTVTFTLSGDTWLGMVNKQINGMQAFMTGKLKLSGDIMLAQKMQDLFP